MVSKVCNNLKQQKLEILSYLLKIDYLSLSGNKYVLGVNIGADMVQQRKLHLTRRNTSLNMAFSMAGVRGPLQHLQDLGAWRMLR